MKLDSENNKIKFSAAFFVFIVATVFFISCAAVVSSGNGTANDTSGGDGELEAMLYSLVGFFMLLLFFMLAALWLYKRISRRGEIMFPREPNLQDPVAPAGYVFDGGEEVGVDEELEKE